MSDQKSDQNGSHNDLSQVLGDSNTLTHDKRMVVHIQNVNIYLNPANPAAAVVGSTDLQAQVLEMLKLLDPGSATAILEVFRKMGAEVRRVPGEDGEK